MIFSYCDVDQRTAFLPAAPPEAPPEAPAPGSRAWAEEVYRLIKAYDLHERVVVLQQLSRMYPHVEWFVVAREVDNEPPAAEPPPRTEQVD